MSDVAMLERELRAEQIARAESLKSRSGTDLPNSTTNQ